MLNWIEKKYNEKQRNIKFKLKGYSEDDEKRYIVKITSNDILYHLFSRWVCVLNISTQFNPPPHQSLQLLQYTFRVLYCFIWIFLFVNVKLDSTFSFISRCHTRQKIKLNQKTTKLFIEKIHIFDGSCSFFSWGFLLSFFFL